MKIYAEAPLYRTGQIVRDVLVALWVLLWVRIGLRVYELVQGLARPGRSIEEAGSNFSGAVSEAGEDVADVPVIGESLQAPFESIAGAGRFLERAGATQQDVVHTLALWLGVLLAVIPIFVVVYRWLPERLRWIQEANAAHQIRLDADHLQLFAIRAVANRSLGELSRATPDPGGALARGDYLPLAALELEALGLKVEQRARPRRGTE